MGGFQQGDLPLFWQPQCVGASTFREPRLIFVEQQADLGSCYRVVAENQPVREAPLSSSLSMCCDADMEGIANTSTMGKLGGRFRRIGRISLAPFSPMDQSSQQVQKFHTRSHKITAIPDFMDSNGNGKYTAWPFFLSLWMSLMRWSYHAFGVYQKPAHRKKAQALFLPDA